MWVLEDWDSDPGGSLGVPGLALALDGCRLDSCSVLPNSGGFWEAPPFPPLLPRPPPCLAPQPLAGFGTWSGARGAGWFSWRLVGFWAMAVAGLLLAPGDGGVLFSKTQVPDLAAQRLFNEPKTTAFRYVGPETHHMDIK